MWWIDVVGRRAAKLGTKMAIIKLTLLGRDPKTAGATLAFPALIASTFFSTISCWGMASSTSLRLQLSSTTVVNMRPCELHSPVLGEAEWIAGFPGLTMVLGEIREAVGGKVEVKRTCGRHINVSFDDCLGETDGGNLGPSSAS